MAEFFLADDLSGALDAGAAFRDEGWRVSVVLTPEAWTGVENGELIGVTTETRNAPAARAAEAVTAALAAGRRHGARLWLKKIDSTLRGPVAAELGALLAARPDARVLFAPANPAVGRTVRNGILLVRGVPVAETEFGRDPVVPVTESSIPRLLGGAAGGRVVIADAETDADLMAAVDRMAAGGGEWVGVGSGALAAALARRRPGSGARSGDGGQAALSIIEACAGAMPGRVDALGAVGEPVLFICGSAHPANRAQALQLGRDHRVGLHSIALDAPVVAGQAAAASLRTLGLAGLIAPERPAGAGSSGSELVLRAVVEAACHTISDTGVRRLMITGGETAFALCRRLGLGRLALDRQLEPGFALASAALGSVTWRFAIKPGGFGSEAAWTRAARALAALPVR